MMQLKEGTHYRVRQHQPLPTPKKSKEAVDCLLCSHPGESDEEDVENVARRKRSRPKGRNIRLDRLLHHIKKEHPDATRDGARSLLTMGFTRQALGGASHTAHDDAGDGDGDGYGNANVDSDGDAVMTSGGLGNLPAASTLGQPFVVIQPTTAIVERGSATMRTDYASIGQHVHVGIEAAAAAQVWPSAATIAKEVWKLKSQHEAQQRGPGLFRQIWSSHNNEAAMVRDAGFGYRATDEEGSEIYCPICVKYGGKDGAHGDNVITSYPKLGVTRKAIGRHLKTARHMHALEQDVKEKERLARRARVGLTVARAALQTIRGGNSYRQFEEKLLEFHLAGSDIGSMNHSVRFIRGFVDSMEVVMDKRIRDHMHGVDRVTNRKRLFAIAADKVTALHRTCDAVGMLIMTDEGELKTMFLDYLLVTQHTGDALMRGIYE